MEVWRLRRVSRIYYVLKTRQWLSLIADIMEDVVDRRIRNENKHLVERPA